MEFLNHFVKLIQNSTFNVFMKKHKKQISVIKLIAYISPTLTLNDYYGLALFST